MKVFKDAAERQWNIEVDYAAIRRVRDVFGVNLLDAVNKPVLADPITLIDVLFAICKPQIDKHGLSDDQFLSSLRGDVLDAAAVALIEEVVDFFPNPTRRAALHRVHRTAQTVINARMERADATLTDQAIEELITKALDSPPPTLNGSFGSEPELSGSAPMVLPSVS